MAFTDASRVGRRRSTSSARAQRERLVGCLRKVRAAIDDFKPDFVLIWGDDQYENFREEIIPPYCISAHPGFEFGPPAKNVWVESVDKRFRLRLTVMADW